MTGIGSAPQLDSAAFAALFDAAQHAVFRLEARQTYAVPADDDELVAFRTGAPRPERSVRTSPWLRRIAVQTAAGVAWSRLRTIERPLTEYTRFELVAYVESQAAGEEIRLLERPLLHSDFWLIDPGRSGQVAVLMHYDGDGRLQRRERVDEPAEIARLDRIRETSWSAAAPLNIWLAGEAAAARA